MKKVNIFFLSLITICTFSILLISKLEKLDLIYNVFVITWIVVQLYLAICLENKLTKLFLTWTISIPIFLLIAEQVLPSITVSDKKIVRTGGYATSKYWDKGHPLLGYAPKPNVSVNSNLTVNKENIYNVEYNIDKLGLRVTPYSNKESNHCFAFFGGSNTFGEGVNDHETLPSQVAYKLRKYRTFNFGFHGYGPHQMLRMLSSDITKKLFKNCDKLLVIYSAIYPHVPRANGYSPWEYSAPRYKLESDGQIVFVDNNPNNFFKYSRLASYSYFFGLISKWVYKRKSLDSTLKEEELYIKIVERSKQIVTNKFHGKFHIIFWDTRHSPSISRIMNSLRNRNLDLINSTDILKGDLDYYNKHYTVHPDDGHPNSSANELIADYLIKYLNIN